MKDFLSSGKYKTIILISNKLYALDYNFEKKSLQFKLFHFKKVLTL